MIQQEKLVELLRHKGIGPQGSKSLQEKDLSILSKLFQNEEVSLTTKATMLSAFLVLEPNEHEKTWLDNLHKNPEVILPVELLGFLSSNNDVTQQIINKSIRKEELTSEEAASTLQLILDNKIPDYQKAAFLEALRLKRETFEENLSFYQVFLKNRKQLAFEGDILIDICDAYDGMARYHNYSLFSASVLAALGVPTIIHGLDVVAPKKGITHHQILKAAGKNPLLSLEENLEKLKSNNCAFIDQSVSFEKLYSLKKMREEMVKRPFLATFEKLLQPIRATNGNFIVAAYTHKHYKDEVVNLLAQAGEVNKALHYKGFEATTQLNPSRAVEYQFLNNGNVEELTIDPLDYKIKTLSPTHFKEGFTAQEIVEEGVKALKGIENEARSIIKFQVAIILKSLGWTQQEVINKTEEVILNGKALNHWNNF